MVSASSHVFKIGHVPEHFSTPLYMALEEGYFNKYGVQVELVLCPAGTGEMIAKLADGSIDIAIALTEGLVAGLANGKDHYKMIGTYVESPLLWALSAGSNSEHTSIDSLRDTTVAISRYGSGSHIMAYVLADRQGWLKESAQPTNGANVPFQFQVLETFKPMRDAVNAGTSDFFMWETFTTKPYHDSGEVKRIGQIQPEWPAFTIAASTNVLDDHAEEVCKVLQAITEASVRFEQEKHSRSIELVQKRMGYTEQDVRDWFQIVSYPKDARQISHHALEGTLNTLRKAGVIKQGPISVNALCEEKVAQVIA